MTIPCFDIAEIISAFFMEDDFRVEAARPATDISALISTRLDAETREQWDLKRATMPNGVMRQFEQAMRDAAQHELGFRFENMPPDDVRGFARERAIEVSFRYSETEIVARIAQTRRHPSHLRGNALAERAG
ncbi:MAG TPA: hypothetical protein QGF05_10545 [Dehalococcoidia bacterium]|nr:hypothetical protein [Dehalococcoidia bacterium]